MQSAKDIQLDDEKMKSMFVIFLTNVIPHRNIWNSLGMSGNLMIFKEVLCVDPGVGILKMIFVDLISWFCHCNHWCGNILI